MGWYTSSNTDNRKGAFPMGVGVVGIGAGERGCFRYVSPPRTYTQTHTNAHKRTQQQQGKREKNSRKMPEFYLKTLLTIQQKYTKIVWVTEFYIALQSQISKRHRVQTAHDAFIRSEQQFTNI